LGVGEIDFFCERKRDEEAWEIEIVKARSSRSRRRSGTQLLLLLLGEQKGRMDGRVSVMVA
jgi:hypothetical protein